MRQASRIISTYTADVMGIPSALYELGGLIVMHDPSGCNSTYATHDEPRWFSKPSNIYISALEQFDAVLGRDEKLINDVVETAEQLQPNFIAICGTIVPSMFGTDFKAIARIVEARTHIPTLGFQTNSMHSYVKGVNMAMESVAKRFCKNFPREQKTVNLLGVTPLDFSVNGNAEALKEFFEMAGYKVNSLWTMNSTFESICGAAKAKCNIVVSSCGLSVAEFLKNKFNIPYVVACPCGTRFSQEMLCAIENKTAVKYPKIAASENYIIGESVTAASMRAELKLDYNIDANVICPTEFDGDVLLPSDLLSSYEEEIEAKLKNAKLVFADPMYLPIVPKSAKFIPLPHEACSGRIYRSNMPVFVAEHFNKMVENLFTAN